MDKIIWYRVWDRYYPRDSRYAETSVKSDISKEALDELIDEEIHEYMNSSGLEVWTRDFEVLPEGTLPPVEHLRSLIKSHEKSAKYHLDEADRLDALIASTLKD